MPPGKHGIDQMGGLKKFDIPFAKASMSSIEINYANDAVSNGWGKKCYEYIDKFEAKFKEYLGVNHAIATSSCTGAMHIAMRTLGIGAGDEVIVPEVTWIATVSPLIYEKATPIFVDIDPVSWCLDVSKVEELITPKTKAIIAVHLYGNLCNLNDLRKICDKHNLYLIEDAAEALGSELHGRKAGSVGDIGVFSFHGTKTITTGEGGMLVCNDAEIYEKALLQSNHGRKPSKHTTFWMDEVGVKYKMSNIQAAIGCGQLERIESFVDRKREIFYNYRSKLSDFLDLNMNHEGDNEKNSFWLPAITCVNSLKEDERDAIVQNANNYGVGLRPFFYPLTRFPMFSQSSVSGMAQKISSSGINLPSYHEITQKQMDVVIEKIKLGLCS